jgi:hypothetical protein
MTKLQKAEQEAARDDLRAILPAGSTVYTVLRHVSASGMSRNLDCYALATDSDGKAWIRRITWQVCKATGHRYNRRAEALTITGCGMDMGFAVVNDLSMGLYCPERYTHQGAYALRHEWL